MALCLTVTSKKWLITKQSPIECWDVDIFCEILIGSGGHLKQFAQVGDVLSVRVMIN